MTSVKPVTLPPNLPGCIGRLAAIGHGGKCYVATVIDQVAGTTKPKRVRIQRDPFLQGEVLQPHEYTFLEWADDD